MGVCTLALLLFACVGVLLLAAGTPIAVALALSGAVALVIEGIVPIMQIFQTMVAGADSWVLTAIPLFILAGELMGQGGITKRLVGFTRALLGWVPGALAVVNVVVSMIFGGASGSALADTASVGPILIPPMVEEGYDVDYACAVTASSSPIGIVIPPSIPMVVFASISNTSVAKLFMGGIGAGVLLGVTEIIVCLTIAKMRGHRPSSTFSWKALVDTSKDGISALMMPAIVIGGIISGFFTPTEAAGVAALYGLVLAMLVYKEIRLRDLPRILLRSANTTGQIMFVAVAARVAQYVFARYNIPEIISSFVAYVNLGPQSVLLVTALVFVVLGMFMGVNEAILLAVPVLLPALTSVGVDLIHAGLVIVVTAGLGLLTPPVCLCVFITSALTGRTVEHVVRASIPFMIAICFVVLVIILFPPIVTYLPRRFSGL